MMTKIQDTPATNAEFHMPEVVRTWLTLWLDQNELYNLEKCPKLTVIRLEGVEWDSFTIHAGTFNSVVEMDISRSHAILLMIA